MKTDGKCTEGERDIEDRVREKRGIERKMKEGRKERKGRERRCFIWSFRILDLLTFISATPGPSLSNVP